MYYTRTVTTSFQYGVSQLDTDGPTDEHRIDYLRAMSPDPGGHPFRAHTEETVAWSTAEALRRRVEELHSLVERRFQSLIYGAQEFTSTPLSTVSAPIAVRIVDQRSKKSVPLPKIGR